MTYVTDTHPLVWFLGRVPRLSRTARAAFRDTSARLVIPTMVLVEIKFLFARGRITVDVADVLAHVASAPNCLIHPLDEEVVGRLPTSLNIHDAIIVSTAVVYRDAHAEQVALITKDAEITASGLVDIVW
jgi:PIN domain nuclease of toxin-antitoxin system